MDWTFTLWALTGIVETSNVKKKGGGDKKS